MNRLIIGFVACLICFSSTFVLAGEPVKKTVEELHLEKDALKGQQIQLQGKVVKVNNGIMKRNFLHIQDGSGVQGTNDLTVTSKQTANVGDQVVIVGTVALDVNFGGGYMYPLLVEKAQITKVK